MSTWESNTSSLQGPVTVVNVHEQDEITKAAERELAQRFREDVAEVLVAGEPLEDELPAWAIARILWKRARGCGAIP